MRSFTLGFSIACSRLVLGFMIGYIRSMTSTCFCEMGRSWENSWIETGDEAE